MASPPATVRMPLGLQKLTRGCWEAFPVIHGSLGMCTLLSPHSINCNRILLLLLSLLACLKTNVAVRWLIVWPNLSPATCLVGRSGLGDAGFCTYHMQTGCFAAEATYLWHAEQGLAIWGLRLREIWIDGLVWWPLIQYFGIPNTEFVLA